MNGHISDVTAIVEFSTHNFGNIRQNITKAHGLKAVILVTTVLGIIGLWPAIPADTGATVLVTINLFRLLKR